VSKVKPLTTIIAPAVRSRGQEMQVNIELVEGSVKNKVFVCGTPKPGWAS